MMMTQEDLKPKKKRNRGPSAKNAPSTKKAKRHRRFGESDGPSASDDDGAHGSNNTG